MSNMLKGIACGAVVGTAVGMMLMPKLDRRTQRKMKRAGRRLAGVAGETYENMMGMMK